jgi:Tfp pilus assembly protein PilF
MTTNPACRVFALSSALLIALLLAGCGVKHTEPGTSAAVVAAMSRGVALMGQYNYDGAVKAFDEALRAEPSLAEAKVNLAIARFNRGQKEQQDVEQSQALLEAVLQHDPANARAWYFKGIILQHIGQAQPAIDCLLKAVQLRPNDGVAWYVLGLCKQRAGQDCQRELLRAVELRPYLASAYYRLWQTLQAAGKSEQAAPYLAKFKQLRESPLAETIELPQYNQMGDMALALPIGARQTPPITKSTLAPQKPTVLFTGGTTKAVPSSGSREPLDGIAAGDFDGDGRPDLLVVTAGADGHRRLVLLRGVADGTYRDATVGSGLENVQEAAACAVGDYDNDGVLDLFVSTASGGRLFRGKGDGTFEDTTAAAHLSIAGSVHSAAFVDADHDGDLDLIVCASSPAGLQLWNNNADGVFTLLTGASGLPAGDGSAVAVLPGDVDADRDMDLVVLRRGAPATILINDLLGKYREFDPGVAIRGDLGGVLQDFNGDGVLDLAVLGGNPARLHLYLGEGNGKFHEDPSLAQAAAGIPAAEELRGLRAVDLDLDGDLDLVAIGRDAHVFLNDGAGRFVLQSGVWPAPAGAEVAAAELFDLNGDLVPDLLRVEHSVADQLVLVPGSLTPPSTALAVAPTGMRGRDKRTRSPASGFGASLLVRAGLHEQRLLHTGLSGGPNQSALPVVFGLGGARQADYLQIFWSDAVSQVETAVAAGQTHKVSELQRKISSCPVLFTWNGTRFEFITDFAGIGGLGYFVAPGEYAQPQILEHVRIAPGQLQPRNGAYELRFSEPMEESAYVDRVELLAIDHPAGTQVFPDERLAVTGPAPTHQLLVVDQPVFARQALDPDGRDCTEQLARIDRVYAYEPERDRRFFGFCQPHTLELDFADRLSGFAPAERVFLFISGSLEYPYSQTAYAASQAAIGWQPIRIERQENDGTWRTIVPDAGAFGGMGRTMTVDVTGLVTGPTCRLRLTTNLEISYDQVFVARDAGAARAIVNRLPVMDADLRYFGFAREYSPDGRLPLIYDYDLVDATAPFDILRGAYTRYGDVKELLTGFDDDYVIMGPGDEIAVKFDATRLAAPAASMERTFILVSHAYCKDMDLYTGTPETLEPLPFRAMSRYPYPSTEHYPDNAEHQRLRAKYNTRKVE